MASRGWVPQDQALPGEGVSQCPRLPASLRPSSHSGWPGHGSHTTLCPGAAGPGTGSQRSRPRPGCSCESDFTDGTCEDLSGRCYCRPNFSGEQCDSCAEGFLGFPSCYREGAGCLWGGGVGAPWSRPQPQLCTWLMPSPPLAVRPLTPNDTGEQVLPAGQIVSKCPRAPIGKEVFVWVPMVLVLSLFCK